MNRLIGLLIVALCSFMLGRNTANAPIPVPWPIPDVVPDDKPPVPGDGKHCLILWETADVSRLPKAQFDALSGTAIYQLLDNSGFEWRKWDDDQDASLEDQWFRDAIALERTSLPWIVISNGKTGFSGPLPGRQEDILELIAKYE